MVQQTESARLGNPLLAQQQGRLNSYGWISQKDGVVHIPINQAMQLILKQDQLKVRPDSLRDRPKSDVPSGANSGRGSGGNEP
jgi:hypothetical protein